MGDNEGDTHEFIIHVHPLNEIISDSSQSYTYKNSTALKRILLKNQMSLTQDIAFTFFLHSIFKIFLQKSW